MEHVTSQGRAVALCVTLGVLGAVGAVALAEPKVTLLHALPTGRESMWILTGRESADA